MTTPPRRRFLQQGFAAGVTALVVAILKPLRALAAEWPKSAFESRDFKNAVRNLFGTTQTVPSTALKITAPYHAENGASVRLVVTTNLPSVNTIAVFVEKNERPLIMSMNFANAEPYISLRLKMAQSSVVHVIARSKDKLYSAKQNIRVTVGGCGG